MAGLKKFVNDLIQKHNFGNLIGTVSQIEGRVDNIEVVKANLYIVTVATDMKSDTTAVGGVTLKAGDFVLDTATPKLWIVKAAGTNKYITLA